VQSGNSGNSTSSAEAQAEDEELTLMSKRLWKVCVSFLGVRDTSQTRLG